MLQSIRNNAQGVFVWIVVGLIVVSFALFGLGSYLSGASKVIAASVNGTEISSTALTRAYQNYQERLRQRFGDQYPSEIFSTGAVRNEVLQGLITQEVMNQMLFEQGFQASDAQIFEKIKQYKEFQEDGVFSAQRYKDVLALQNLNGEAFENNLSRDIASQQLRAAITLSAFLTEKEKKTLAALENQNREIGYFDISVRLYRDSIKISNEEINAYYKKNPRQYLTTEKVLLEYIELNMDDVAALQEVTNEMIKQQYESSPTRYMANDNAAAEKKILALRKQIKAGADFATLAKKYSQDKGSAKQGGDLGYLTRGLEENFDKVVFALNKGEVSNVIKAKQGFQLVMVDDIRDGDPEERKVRHILIKPENKLKPFADVKVAIKKELQYQLASKVFFDDADQMNNISYENPDSLQPVADALALKIKQSPLITRQGGAGIFSNQKILSAAFSDEVLNNGRNSELLELSDTQLVVVRIKEHKPARVKALVTVKRQIENSLLKEKSSNKVAEVSADVVARLNNNESVAAIQKRYKNIKWTNATWIKRKAEKDSKLLAQVRSHAFTMAKPVNTKTTWDKVILPSGDQTIIALYKVAESKDTLIDDARFTRVIGNADYESFVQYLKSQADISISQAVIDVDAK